MKTLLILILISFKLHAGLAPPPMLIFVGDGSGACTLTSIQDAIDMATPNSEIRVTREITYFENLLVDKNLTIKGGYTTCGLAQLDSRADENRSTINAGGAGNAVEVVSPTSVLNMSGFILSNGQNEGNLVGDANGGAMSVLADQAEVTLTQMQLSGNSGNVGGGVYMGGDEVSLTLENTLIDSNVAKSGGGIYCSNNGDVLVYENSGVVGNIANGQSGFDGFGGGIFALQCDVFLRSGEGGQNGFHLVGISSNIAENDGGGIYAAFGIVRTDGYFAPINIDHNVGKNGGGIYLASAKIHLYNLFFDENLAQENGGALYMNNSHYIASSISNPTNYCLPNGHDECNLFVDNKANGDFGGAIFMESNSKHLVEEFTIMAKFINNYANNGSAITALSGSSIKLQNTFFIGNGDEGNSRYADNSTIYTDGNNSLVNVYNSTLVNNKTHDIFSIANESQVFFINSIAYDASNANDVVVTQTGGTFAFGCSLFHEGDTIGDIPVFNLSAVTTDPGFVDAENDNYSLRPDSVAIDRCLTAGVSEAMGIFPDFDMDTRPMNTFGGMNQYDAGADEYNDVIFKNGLDSEGVITL